MSCVGILVFELFIGLVCVSCTDWNQDIVLGAVSAARNLLSEGGVGNSK